MAAKLMRMLDENEVDFIDVKDDCKTDADTGRRYDIRIELLRQNQRRGLFIIENKIKDVIRPYKLKEYEKSQERTAASVTSLIGITRTETLRQKGIEACERLGESKVS
ncbi:MAG: hypothetical protein WAV38_34470 [Xanthobacteraceae bacterium]